MYGIKRQVKKTHSTSNNNSVGFKSSGKGIYKYPNYDDIPAGKYIARIVDMEDTITSKGKKAINVYYYIEELFQCSRRCKNNLPKNYVEKSYYIKQTYVCGTTYCEDFLDSVSMDLYGETGKVIKRKDVNKCELIVTLSYIGNNTIGGISNYQLIDYNDFLDNASEQRTDYILNIDDLI